MVALGRQLFEALQTDRLQVERWLLARNGWRSGLSVADLVEQRSLARPIERPPPRQQLIKDDSQGVDVGPWADRRGVALDLLGRHVRPRSHQRAADSAIACMVVIEDLGEA